MHSDFFKAMFTSGLQEAQVSHPTINLSEHPATIVRGVLKYMYTGSLSGEIRYNYTLIFHHITLDFEIR